MTPEAWFEAVAVVLIIAGWVFTRIVARSRARKAKIEKINEKIDALGEAPAWMRGVLDRLEGIGKELHNHDKALIEMRERLKATQGIRQAVDRLYEHELKSGK